MTDENRLTPDEVEAAIAGRKSFPGEFRADGRAAPGDDRGRGGAGCPGVR